ncbi:type II toxin-antitoxin system HipA family toxin [Pseudomonas sp.]|uniref:type II toxin-antitoxin system HipA family toxin n=1 Tax=Pseudomonas sp. TaxID=306 RepID=UPI003A973902
MHSLTLQLYSGHAWHDAMHLSFEQPEAGLAGACSFGYEQTYLLETLDHIGSRLEHAVSVTVPLDWESHRASGAPAFLHDILPAGAARRFLLQRLGEQKPEHLGLDLFLLSRCAPAPVGNLRIKEAATALQGNPLLGFSREDVINRDARFLEYAYEQGAAIGGATGAGGEAPKLLLTEDREGVLHPDAVLPDDSATRHWFVKFARNQARQTDQDILRSEFCYYRAVQRLGLDTVPAEGLALEEGRKPSLWMHRFDRHLSAAGLERSAMESLYSLAGVTVPGSYLLHTDALSHLVRLWQQTGQGAQVDDMILEYLQRDLLNQILGNSDNHGRNTSVLRNSTGLKLAPIYDLAPMVMDDEGITRTTKWPQPIEVAGEVNWRQACASLAQWTNAEVLYERLRGAAQNLLALPDLLSDQGLPSATMNHPRIALRNLRQRLGRWELV